MTGATRQQVTTRRDITLCPTHSDAVLVLSASLLSQFRSLPQQEWNFSHTVFFFLGPGLVFHCVTGTQQLGLAHLSEPEWYKAAGQNHTALNMSSLSAAAAIKEVQI